MDSKFHSNYFFSSTCRRPKFIIYRCTDLSPLPAQFNAGSSIKAQDLNDNFFVLQSAIEEARCSIERQSEVSDERYLQELSDDTTPQLGGDLDLNGHKLKGILKVDSSDQNNQGTIRLNCRQNDDHFVALKAPSHSDFTSSINSIVFKLPANAGSSTQVLGQSNATDDGNGNYTVDLAWVNQASGGGGIALNDLSASTASAGSTALTYNNQTGVFIYIPPDLSGYLTSYTVTSSDLGSIPISALQNVSTSTPQTNDVLKWNGSTWQPQAEPSSGINELLDDTTPQLGGNLDMNSKFISSGVLGVKNAGSRSQLQLFCESGNAHYVALQAPAHSDFSGNITFTLPATDGTANQVLKTDGNGNLGWVTQSSGSGGSTLSDGDKGVSRCQTVVLLGPLITQLLQLQRLLMML